MIWFDCGSSFELSGEMIAGDACSPTSSGAALYWLMMVRRAAVCALSVARDVSAACRASDTRCSLDGDRAKSVCNTQSMELSRASQRQVIMQD